MHQPNLLYEVLYGTITNGIATSTTTSTASKRNYGEDDAGKRRERVTESEDRRNKRRGIGEDRPTRTDTGRPRSVSPPPPPPPARRRSVNPPPPPPSLRRRSVTPPPPPAMGPPPLPTRRPTKAAAGVGDDLQAELNRAQRPTGTATQHAAINRIQHPGVNGIQHPGVNAIQHPGVNGIQHSGATQIQGLQITKPSPPTNAPTAPRSHVSGSVKTGLMPANRKPLSRHDFIPGHIIWAPCHQTNLDPNAKPGDRNITQSEVGMISSKSRMMVVLWAYSETLFALPLSSHSKHGLTRMNASILHEFICLYQRPENNLDRRGDENFDTQGTLYPPLEVAKLRNWNNKELGKYSSIRLTNGITVNMREDIEIVGYMSDEDSKRLLRLWFQIASEARDFGFKNEQHQQEFQ